MPIFINEEDADEFRRWKRKRQESLAQAQPPDPAWRAATQPMRAPAFPPANVYEEFPGATAPQPVARDAGWQGATQPAPYDVQRPFRPAYEARAQQIADTSSPPPPPLQPESETENPWAAAQRSLGQMAGNVGQVLRSPSPDWLSAPVRVPGQVARGIGNVLASPAPDWSVAPIRALGENVAKPITEAALGAGRVGYEGMMIANRDIGDPISGLVTEATAPRDMPESWRPYYPPLRGPAEGQDGREWWWGVGKRQEERRAAGMPSIEAGLLTPLAGMAPGEIAAASRGMAAGIRGVPQSLRAAGAEATQGARAARNELVTRPDVQAAVRRMVPGATVEAAPTVATKRYYHGTGSTFDSPDVAKFDPNGLYGPGYYLTDNPEVAGSYASKGGIDSSMLAKLESDIVEYRRLAEQSPSQREWFNSLANMVQSQLDIAGGPQTRAINLPKNLRLLDVEAPVPPKLLRAIIEEFSDPGDSSALIRFRDELPNNSTGHDLWQALHHIIVDRETPNVILQRNGYDGIRYQGGKRIPMRDAAGNAIEHEAIVIFPESLPKITNALSGKPMGTPPEVGAAVLGGVLGSTQGDTPQERARNALIGAATGGVGMAMVRRGRVGLSIQDISQSANPANRALARMYNQPTPPITTPGLASNKFEAGRRAIVRGWFDRDVDMGQWQKAAEKAKGSPLTPDEMAYESKRLNSDKAAETRLQEGLRPALQAVGKDRTALSVYLTHQDNIDVARVMNNPNRKFSGGLTVADSQQALQDMEAELGPERMAAIKGAADQVWTLNRALLQRKVDSGLITQELFDALTDPVKGYPHYVPTRITDYLTEPSNVGRGKSLSVRDTGLKRNTVEGTAREREDPLASVVRNAYQTEALARKNETFQAFIKQSQYDPEMARLVRPVDDSYKATRDEVKITGFLDGKRETYVVPKPMESLVKGEPSAVIPGLSGAIWSGMMGLFRAVTTAASPVFLAKNATLDIASYAVRESSRAGGPQNLPKVLYELIPAYADAFRGILQQTYHGSAADFLKGGGGQFGFFQGTQGEARATVESLARGNVFTINNAGDLGRLAKSLATLGPVRGVGERIELAPRVAAYRLAQKRGASEVRSVINGRTVTMDFQQGGDAAKVINQFVPFFNVGMQAPAQIVRAFRENPRAFIATTTTLMAGPVLAAEAWNRSDPQRARDYDDVPQYVKDQGIVVMLPGQVTVDAKGNRRPAYVQFRFREFAPIAIITREAANRALGDDPREWQDLLGNGLLSISPVQGNNPADMISSFTPLGVSTILQEATDQDYFRGRKIATKSQDEQASAASKAVGGALGVRPSQVEFAVRDLGGGVGGAVLAASDIIAGKQPETPQERPVIGGITGAFSRSSIGGRLDKAKQRILSDEAKSFLKASGVDLNIAPNGYTINNIPLTMAEQEEYQVKTNQYIDEGIKKLRAWARFMDLNPDDRHDNVQTMIRNARDQAADEVLRKMGAEQYRKRRNDAMSAASR